MQREDMVLGELWRGVTAGDGAEGSLACWGVYMCIYMQGVVFMHEWVVTGTDYAPSSLL